MQIEPNEVLNIVIVASLCGAAIGFLIGAWCGIGSEKSRIRKLEKTARGLIDYYRTLKIELPAERLVPRFPPGPLAELYNQKDIEEVLTAVNKSFPDRMKAAKAAKRKA